MVEGVSVGYYEWRGRAPSWTQVRRDRLAVLVWWSFDRSDGTYGYRRIHADLARHQVYADDETIRSIVRELGLVACQLRPWRPTTTVAGDVATTPDLLRQYLPKGTDLARWNIGDLAAVAATLSSRPRKTLQWRTPAEAFGDQLTRFNKPVSHRPVEPKQHTSQEFADFTDALSLRRSVGRTGTCYDNAWAG